MSGYHILGAAQDRVITVRLKNAVALARGQSAIARVASIVPTGDAFIEGQTYEAVAQKIGESLAAQGADASVQVVDWSTLAIGKPGVLYAVPAKRPALPGEEPESEVWKVARTYKWGLVAGVGLSIASALVWHFFFREVAHVAEAAKDVIA